MILEAAIGDAYGAGFEFRELDFIHKNNDLTQYHPHGLYTEIYKRYTDDTQMAIAISELLLEDDNWNEIKVADKFVEVFHRDKRRGYSDRVYNALDMSKNGREFINNLSFQSNGNGSAMRAYSIGYIRDVQKLLEFCEIQAKTSHHTIEGISGAKRIALAVHYHLYIDNQSVSLIDYINEVLQENEIYEIISPIDMHAYPTTKAVIRIVSEYTSMKKCLLESINYGGDTDTVAALSMAILSHKKNCINDLPSFLYDNLENDSFGKNFLIDLDVKLKNKFNI